MKGISSLISLVRLFPGSPLISQPLETASSHQASHEGAASVHSCRAWVSQHSRGHGPSSQPWRRGSCRRGLSGDDAPAGGCRSEDAAEGWGCRQVRDAQKPHVFNRNGTGTLPECPDRPGFALPSQHSFHPRRTLLRGLLIAWVIQGETESAPGYACGSAACTRGRMALCLGEGGTDPLDTNPENWCILFRY